MSSNKLIVLFCLWYGLFGALVGRPVVHGQEEIKLLALYPSDQEAFTQGLEVHPMLESGQLLMGTGLYGESSLGILDLETGEYKVKDALDEQYFGEGITVTDEVVWQLTWKEGTAFKRDLLSFDLLESVDYAGEGWGLAYDEDRQILWHSDGSSQLSLRDPDTFDLLGQLEVTYQQQAVTNLNELEYANGLVYANVWFTDLVIAINPENGHVQQVYDLHTLLEEVNQDYSAEAIEKMDVLNGIAHKEGDVFYLTGKQYPYILEVELPR